MFAETIHITVKMVYFITGAKSESVYGELKFNEPRLKG